MSSQKRLRRAEKLTDPYPTEYQKTQGAYKKGIVNIRGLKIVIENPKGSIRSGINENGEAWQNTMTETYGYISDTLGKDGDEVDIFIGTYTDTLFDVYVIDQINPNSGAFDEHKVMFGFKNAEEAKKTYLDNYDKDWKGFKNITTLSLSQFKSWVFDKNKTQYPAIKTKMDSIDYKDVDIGSKISLIKLTGEVIAEQTLQELQSQAGDADSYDTLILEIASPGGSVSEGLEIMVWLDLLSQQGKKIISVVTANAYSIASLIMLAADMKLISKHGKVMVHNPMVPELKYANANELEQYVSELRDLEAMMYQLYETFTGLKTEQIKALMDQETYLDPKEAVKYGFADLVVDINPRSYEMALNNKKEVNMSKTINILNRVIAKVNMADFVNQLYYDTDGGYIEIFQNDPSTYQEGDRTSLESGTVTLLDGSTLLIEDFVIKDIQRGVEPSQPMEPIEPIQPPMEPIPSTEPAAPSEPVIPEEEEVSVIPQEPSQPTQQVPEEPIQQEPIPAEEPVEASFNEGPAPLQEPEDRVAELEARIKELENKLEAKAKEEEEMVNKIKAIEEEYQDKFKAFEQFQNKAAEAIEDIVTNTTSSFKPVARATEEPAIKGSIFQRAKARAAGAQS